MEKNKFFKIISKAYLVIGLLLIFFAFTITSITFYPNIWYSIDKGATETEASSIQDEIIILQEKNIEDIKRDIDTSLPPLDESLPKDNMILISGIGVDSVIIQNENAKQGLEEGIWIAPNFGIPNNNDLPIIISAHRFGYVYWTTNFRMKSSFYNLPKLRVGDRVQIIWEQRSYEYEVYKVEDNTQITDYDADLILYTCRMYNSPVRVFRYLSRVN
jgi:sortase (surface protein transpeptidase)